MLAAQDLKYKICAYCSITFSITHLMIFIYHLISTLIKNKAAKLCNERDKSKVSILLSFVMFLFGIIANSTLVYNIFNPLDRSDKLCHVSVHLATLYLLFKSTMYLILATKLWELIADYCSILQISDKKLKIWILVVMIWSTVTMLALNIFIKAGDACSRIIPLPFYVNSISLDIIGIIVNIYFFTKPWYVLAQSEDEHFSLKKIVIKYCILSAICVGSTPMIVIGYSIIGIPELFVTFHVMMSSLAIIAMYEWNFWITDCNVLCICCRCVNRKSKKSKTDMEILGKVVNEDQETVVLSPTLAIIDKSTTSMSSDKDNRNCVNLKIPRTSMVKIPSVETVSAIPDGGPILIQHPKSDSDILETVLHDVLEDDPDTADKDVA